MKINPKNAMPLSADDQSAISSGEKFKAKTFNMNNEEKNCKSFAKPGKNNPLKF
tara:strand:- start:206 stop:367 length:162 start_codon:yes stop_codon:yes gene_type:complete